MNEQLEYLQNKNLVYAWADSMVAMMQDGRRFAKISNVVLTDDADTQSNKCIFLLRFVLDDVLGLTEEEALADIGIVERVGLGKYFNRPYIFIPLLNNDSYYLCNTNPTLRELMTRYAIRYAYGKGNPQKMLDLYYAIDEDKAIKGRDRRKNLKASIKFIEKSGVKRTVSAC